MTKIWDLETQSIEERFDLDIPTHGKACPNCNSHATWIIKLGNVIDWENDGWGWQCTDCGYCLIHGWTESYKRKV